MTNRSGNIVNKYAYDKFGNLLDYVEAVPNPFSLVGQYGVMDEGNGLLFMRARYYDPEIGRFLTPDPINLAQLQIMRDNPQDFTDRTDVIDLLRYGLYNPQTLNAYAYVGNNPINWLDPDGRIIINLGAALLGAIGGGVVNGVYAYTQEESFWVGAGVGFGAGFLGGLTLNPFLVGAIVGMTTTAGNIATGIDKPDNNASAILMGAAGGALGGGLGKYIGGALAPNTEMLGQAVGSVAGSQWVNTGTALVDFCDNI